MSTQFHIREEIKIPYFDHDKKLSKTIKNSGARRNMSPFAFAMRKIKNIILYKLTYNCPLNSWRIRMHRWRGVNIGENVYIGMHSVIDNAYPEYIYIEDNVSLAGEVSVIAHSNPYDHFKPIIESKVSPVLIKEGAWVGLKAAILPGVTVGVKSIVSAGTMVDKNVPDYSIAKGNPMKIITSYESLIH